MTFRVPWPPSVNHYYRHVGHKTLIIREGRLYQERIVAIARSTPGAHRITGPVEISIHACPPDNRARDLDNLLKPVLDGLQKAGCYDNDCQVDRLTIVRFPKVPQGGLTVLVNQL